jgi:hypothetical protein
VQHAAPYESIVFAAIEGRPVAHRAHYLRHYNTEEEAAAGHKVALAALNAGTLALSTDPEGGPMYTVHVYPSPDNPRHIEIFKVETENGDPVVGDVALRDAPGVPLTDQQRDAVVEQDLGFVRTGPWTVSGQRASATVGTGAWLADAMRWTPGLSAPENNPL